MTKDLNAYTIEGRHFGKKIIKIVRNDKIFKKINKYQISFLYIIKREKLKVGARKYEMTA